MAHVEHFKSVDIKRITNEFERELECNNFDNRIDFSRTKFNYELQPRRFHKELSVKLETRLSHVNHSTRKDLNVMSSWIITCPQELLDNPDNVKKFFEISYKFCQDRYGADNVLNGYVHMDEKTPHMHTPIVPVKDDRVSAKALFTRKELSSFHSDLDKVCEKEFGVKNLVKNGRTKGNYTVSELKERSCNEQSLKRKEESLDAKETALDARESDLDTREHNLSLKEQKLVTANAAVIKMQQELNDREKNLKDSEDMYQYGLSMLSEMPSPQDDLVKFTKTATHNGVSLYDIFEDRRKKRAADIKRKLPNSPSVTHQDSEDDYQHN